MGASAQPLGEIGTAAVGRPARGRAAVHHVADRRVGTELEQEVNGLLLAGLRGDVERRYTLAVVWPAEGAELVGIGSELYEAADRVEAPVDRRPRERRSAIGISRNLRTELDQAVDRLDTAALRRP